MYDAAFPPMSLAAHDACTTFIVHACRPIIVHVRTEIIIRACTRIIVHACIMIIVKVTFPTGRMFDAIYGRDAGANLGESKWLGAAMSCNASRSQSDHDTLILHLGPKQFGAEISWNRKSSLLANWQRRYRAI